MAKKMYCNKCGKEMDFWDKQEEFSIHTHCGYGTKFDGSDLELDLCCDCMEELADGCKIPPVADIEKYYTCSRAATVRSGRLCLRRLS